MLRVWTGLGKQARSSEHSSEWEYWKKSWWCKIVWLWANKNSKTHLLKEWSQAQFVWWASVCQEWQNPMKCKHRFCSFLSGWPSVLRLQTLTHRCITELDMFSLTAAFQVQRHQWILKIGLCVPANLHRVTVQDWSGLLHHPGCGTDERSWPWYACRHCNRIARTILATKDWLAAWNLLKCNSRDSQSLSVHSKRSNKPEKEKEEERWCSNLST